MKKTVTETIKELINKYDFDDDAFICITEPVLGESIQDTELMKYSEMDFKKYDKYNVLKVEAGMDFIMITTDFPYTEY